MAEIFDFFVDRSLALSLMFWTILDASMLHLLAEMYDSMTFMNCQEGKEANPNYAQQIGKARALQAI